MAGSIRMDPFGAISTATPCALATFAARRISAWVKLAILRVIFLFQGRFSVRLLHILVERY